MIQRLATPLGRFDKHPQIATRRFLPDKFVERFRAQRGVDVLDLAFG
jgi:hypothetical protein